MVDGRLGEVRRELNVAKYIVYKSLIFIFILSQLIFFPLCKTDLRGSFAYNGLLEGMLRFLCNLFIKVLSRCFDHLVDVVCS